MSSQIEKCIQDCLECYRVCEETSAHCLQMGDKHVEAGHMRTMRDCSEICAMAAGFMARGSDFHQQLCNQCADVCERCAASCESVGDDEHMRRCAETCRRCAQSCRDMSGGGGIRRAA